MPVFIYTYIMLIQMMNQQHIHFIMTSIKKHCGEYCCGYHIYNTIDTPIFGSNESDRVYKNQ